MPHASSIFSTHSYLNSIRSRQSHPGQVKPQRNRLRKRQQPFGYSETNVVAYDLSALMGNHHSIESVPRPSRPPRCSTADDIPNLPATLIYKTFASEFPTVTVEEQTALTPEENDDSKISESATGWFLAGTAQDCSADHERERPILPASTHHRDHDQVSAKNPRYDRASRLAESYQSLLPDLESLDYPETHKVIRRHQSERRLGQQYHHHRKENLHHTWHGQTAAAASIPRDGWQSPRPGCPPRSSARIASVRPSSIVTDDSLTAVESDSSPIERLSTTSYLSSATTTLGCQNFETEISHPKGTRQLVDDIFNNATTRKSRNDGGGRSSPKAELPRSSSDYVGLQICSELLTDELIKTFVRQHPDEKHGRASKLQVMLLIEAYEAMLDNCRRELLKTEDGADADRRRHVRDAVRILDHWLDSLYVIYDGTFNDSGGTAKRVGGSEELVGE
ncbi:hypothetical protein B0H66DRAFT_533285 [Apodospora peruviana]|uniref:Uncharacterized protein n=1 Tax=Apodospora peruviana TaxID=516989 RepID=A0AAE0I562_9PEZI|nr:hypothetical protein B0H66DRAFT_533285 [Apodospora peruviana]